MIFSILCFMRRKRFWVKEILVSGGESGGEWWCQLFFKKILSFLEPGDVSAFYLRTFGCAVPKGAFAIGQFADTLLRLLLA